MNYLNSIFNIRFLNSAAGQSRNQLYTFSKNQLEVRDAAAMDWYRKSAADAAKMSRQMNSVHKAFYTDISYIRYAIRYMVANESQQAIVRLQNLLGSRVAADNLSAAEVESTFDPKTAERYEQYVAKGKRRRIDPREARERAALEARIERIGLQFTISRERYRKAVREQSQRAARQLLLNVQKVVAAKGPMTNPELRGAMAAAFAQLSSQAYQALIEAYVNVFREVDKLEQYYLIMEQLQKQPFYIILDDSAIFRLLKELPQTMSSIIFRAQSAIIGIMFAALEQTFTDAFQKLNVNQFPLEYRSQIISCIEKEFTKTIKIVTTKTARDPINQPWVVGINFYDLFGTYADLQKAYHYGAMLKTGGKVEKLPYFGEDFVNPAKARHAYWLSLWLGKSQYSPVFGNKGYQQNGDDFTRTEHRGKMSARIIANQNKIAALEEEQNVLNKRLMTRRSTGGRKKFKPGMGFDETSTDSILEALEKGEEKISFYKARLRYNIRYRDKQPRRIKDAKMKRKVTLQARTDLFKGHSKAPWWILLEYGQLRWEPKIPPQGIYAKFISLAKETVTNYIRTLFNQEFSVAKGFGLGSAGRFYRPRTAGKNEVAFKIGGYIDKRYKTGSRKGQSRAITKLQSKRPGSFLPMGGSGGQTLNPVKDFVGIRTNIRRNIRAAGKDNPAAASAANTHVTSIDKYISTSDIAAGKMRGGNINYGNISAAPSSEVAYETYNPPISILGGGDIYGGSASPTAVKQALLGGASLRALGKLRPEFIGKYVSGNRAPHRQY